MALTIQLLRRTWELESLQLWEWHKVCLMARVDIFMDLGNLLQLGKSFAVVSKAQITRSLWHGADHIGSISRHLCACCNSLECVCLQLFIKNFAQAAAHQHPSSTHELFWHNSHRPDCEQICWCKYLNTLGCLDAEGLSNFDKRESSPNSAVWVLGLLSMQIFLGYFLWGLKNPRGEHLWPFSSSPSSEGENQRKEGLWYD